MELILQTKSYQMKKYFILGLLMSLIGLNSCEQCEELSLPDLFFDSAQIANAVAGGFDIGDIAVVGVSLTNIIDNVSECFTETAGEHNYDFDLFYRANNNEEFQKVGSATYASPSIRPSQFWEDQPEVEFTVSGEFYMLPVADATNQVIERDEDNNNDTQTIASEVKSTASNYIVKVNGDGINKVIPSTKMINFPKKYNLIKVRVLSAGEIINGVNFEERYSK
jgi:hypothetical protein